MAPRLETLSALLLLLAFACQPPPRPPDAAYAPSAAEATKAEETEEAGEPDVSPASPPAKPSEAPPVTQSEAPPSSEFELVALAVPEFLDAVVALPLDRRPRPLLVATHGAGGDPAWTCREWARRVAASHLVLCPRGRAISRRDDHGFYYPDHRVLTAEVLAAVAAVRSTHGARVTAAPIVYTGYSQGASMGSLGLAERGAEFPRLVLTEGGFREWSPKSARRFAESGGKRVLFVCGGRGCQSEAEKSARLLRAAGVETRVEYVQGGGHTDGGAVGERLDRIVGWVLESSSP